MLARLIFLVCALGALWAALDAWGDTRYQAGRAEVMARLQTAQAAADREARATEQRHQEEIDAIESKHAAAQVVAVRRAAAVVVSGDGLRAHIATAVAATGAVPESAQAPGQPDETAAVLGELSRSCSAMAERLGQQAEELADTVRGLQSYADAVSAE